MIKLKKLTRGITILELLVVLAIIGLVVSVVFVGLDKARKVSYDSKILNDVNQIQLAIQIYYQDHDGNYPACPEGVETCCIGTESCLDQNNIPYYKNLFNISAFNTEKPAIANNNLASVYWPQLMGTIRTEGYIYNCPDPNMKDWTDPLTSESIKVCATGDDYYYPTVTYRNSDNTTVVTVPAGSTEKASWNSIVGMTSYIPSDAGCMAQEADNYDPNAKVNYGCIYSGNSGTVTEICENLESPDYGFPGSCRTSSLPNGFGQCWGTATICENQGKFGSGPGWSRSDSSGNCTIGQGYYYNGISLSYSGVGCGFSSGTSGDTGDTGDTGDIGEAGPVTTGTIPGCMDPWATPETYNPNATIDDGSCEYLIVYGCTDSYTPATNYDPNATQDDGTCTYNQISGCTDNTAINYNPSANQDDGSCISYAYGCMDSNANNYDSNANADNGSCTYDTYGCTDSNAINYDPSANTDNGSCSYITYGCTDSSADNYGPSATNDDGSCTYNSSSSS